MATAKVKYLKNLRTEATHLKSGNTLITDAPTDNNGKGEAFSPTDLVASALASCMITIIGIRAEKSNIQLGEISADVTKIMGSEPRMISEIVIELTLENLNYTDKEKKLIETAAKTCPVALSLNQDIKQTITFNYQ